MIQIIHLVLQLRRKEKCKQQTNLKEAVMFDTKFANSAWTMSSVLTVLILVLIQGTQTGVVDDFNHLERCKDFLYMGTPPQGYLGNSFKKICQRFGHQPRYVTLYDPQKTYSSLFCI